MQVWLNFILMVALAAMVGVSVSLNQSTAERARRQTYVEAHSELGAEMSEALLEGELALGMEPEHVLLSWGSPQSVKVSESQPRYELWTYPKATVLFQEETVSDWLVARSAYDTGDDLARRLEYLLTHEGLIERTASLIRKGEITPGMSFEEVEASWGEPTEVLPLYDDNSGERTIWVYERGRMGRTTVTFQEDQVLSSSELPKEEETTK